MLRVPASLRATTSAAKSCPQGIQSGTVRRPGLGRRSLDCVRGRQDQHARKPPPSYELCGDTERPHPVTNPPIFDRRYGPAPHNNPDRPSAVKRVIAATSLTMPVTFDAAEKLRSRPGRPCGPIRAARTPYSSPAAASASSITFCPDPPSMLDNSIIHTTSAPHSRIRLQAKRPALFSPLWPLNLAPAQDNRHDPRRAHTPAPQTRSGLRPQTVHDPHKDASVLRVGIIGKHILGDVPVFKLLSARPERHNLQTNVGAGPGPSWPCAYQAQSADRV